MNRRKSRLKVGVISLGCSKNLVDTEILLGKLKQAGVEFANDPKKADTIIVNTCGFINPAKEEAIDYILEYAGNKKVIVMGCLVERYKQELMKEIPEVAAYFGTESWDEILEFLGLEKVKENKRILTTPKSYAYLKISEGCNRLCSFCTIPQIRGKYRSKTIQDLVEEAKWIAQQGIKEICVVSQDTTYYGRDLYGKNAIIKLLEELEKIDGINWIRLLYLYPTDVSNDLISYIANSSKVLPYFDIPLQHISDRVLKSMRRGYDKSFVERLVNRILSAIPNVVLRTSFIVGYPEEEPEDFQELLDFVEKGYFYWVGVFSYSAEEGTPAEVLGDRISYEEKERRKSILYEVQNEVIQRKNRDLLGKKFQMLVDGYDEDLGIVPVGRLWFQAPEVDGICYLETEWEVKEGDLISVLVKDFKEQDLLVEFVSE
ncbi:30S ribosomal protein S12 methylthiotransferase RimO [Thermocrinis sp.]|uniref:30S ribosomal protein S12 methylthiotransferase RimO n=1 Tax=Thermocrinis sp. TaxID=2024383 RepID=UPI002FDD042D